MPKCQPGCACGKHGGGTFLPAPGRRERDRALHNERAQKYRTAHREQAREASRAWRAANPGRVREWNERNGEKSRLKHLYGLSAEGWTQMLDGQQGCCYLCGEPLDLESRRKIHVDHDHSCCRGVRSCGKCVRGLACEPCNKGIGMFGDNPERMMRAAERLAAANARIATRPVQMELPLNVAEFKRASGGD